LGPFWALCICFFGTRLPPLLAFFAADGSRADDCAFFSSPTAASAGPNPRAGPGTEDYKPPRGQQPSPAKDGLPFGWIEPKLQTRRPKACWGPRGLTHLPRVTWPGRVNPLIPRPGQKRGGLAGIPVSWTRHYQELIGLNEIEWDLMGSDRIWGICKECD